MPDANSLEELQDAALTVIAATRDEVVWLFDNFSQEGDLVDDTLKRLSFFMSSRSQTVSYLVSSNYIWDAEIVLRSFYEANAKIWYICDLDDAERKSAVAEFWGEYASMHNHKRRHRANLALSSISFGRDKSGELVYAPLTDPDAFEFGENNKGERRRLEGKWSFSEIVNRLANGNGAVLDWKPIVALLHMYGQQSHLAHADDAALDLMMDRMMREPDELLLLSASHIARIFSDQATMWVISEALLRHRYSARPRAGNSITQLYSRFADLASSIEREFYAHLERNDAVHGASGAA